MPQEAEVSRFSSYEEVGKAVEGAAENLLEAFIYLDRNGDQKIAATELDDLLTAMGFDGLSAENRQQIIDVFDDNENGEMDLQKFYENKIKVRVLRSQKLKF